MNPETCRLLYDLTVEDDITKSSMTTKILESLHIRKVALNANVRDSPCYKSVYSDDLLKAAKSGNI